MSIKEVLKTEKKIDLIAKHAFSAVDTDKSGYIERNELEQVMNNIANEIGVPKPTDFEIDEVVNELDENQDGKLSFEEFKKLIQQVLLLMVNAEAVSSQQL